MAPYKGNGRGHGFADGKSSILCGDPLAQNAVTFTGKLLLASEQHLALVRAKSNFGQSPAGTGRCDDCVFVPAPQFFNHLRSSQRPTNTQAGQSVSLGQAVYTDHALIHSPE